MSHHAYTSLIIDMTVPRTLVHIVRSFTNHTRSRRKKPGQKPLTTVQREVRMESFSDTRRLHRPVSRIHRPGLRCSRTVPEDWNSAATHWASPFSVAAICREGAFSGSQTVSLAPRPHPYYPRPSVRMSQPALLLRSQVRKRQPCGPHRPSPSS
ncbi:hypothetical protein CALCODRAFT_311682 [Calocera cornea HHB12733]|uniref:Uncharacterized protein n=1 Tax=Calocera cornea HHB12733 TaxID=1353952 RepID=A0A165FFW0_9BASI|nr:hypothetical protein CALCODRAFT_311682 [Calocera cornea HHB12733]